MLLNAVAFLGGHCVLHGLPALPATRWAWVVAGAIGLAALAVRAPRWRPFAHTSLAAVVGFGLAWWHAEVRLADRWPSARHGEVVELDGYVASLVEERSDGRGGAQRFRVDVLDTRNLPNHIDVTWYQTALRPQPGELWHLRVRLRAPHGFANPGGHDYEARLLREAIGATGYVGDSTDNRRLDRARGYWILRLRALVAERLAQAGAYSPRLGIVQGLAVGETARVPNDQWRVFATTGTTHLMAISGLHIGMVAWLGAWLAGRGARFLPLQRWRVTLVGVHAVFGMAAALGYSALAGFSIPTQRTLIMLCAFFGARLARREVWPARGFALAVIGVLLIDPFAPLASGFWLSFGAVAVIFLATTHPGIESLRARGYEFVRLQAIVTVGLAPVLIGTFGTVSVVAPFVNALAIPLFTLLLVPAVLIASAMLLLSEQLGSALLWVPLKLLEVLWPALEWIGALPLALWSLPQLPWWAFVLLVLGVFVVLAPGIAATRYAGVLLCLPAACWQAPRPASGAFTLHLLDVGQGLAIVVTTQRHTLVYDTGPAFRSGRDAGEMVVVPFLHARGVRHLDAVIVSHGDADHVGGLESLGARLSIRHLLLGPSVTSRTQTTRCTAGQRWEWDGVRFEMIYPPPDLEAVRRNDSSCVLRIDARGGSAVLLGDIEREAERWLVDSQAIRSADIAIVPHHGSRTSSSAELIAQIRPRFALVSAGFGNQWGFPKPDVLARWHAGGAATFQTADSGALEIDVTAAGVHAPRAYRKEFPRYWR